MQSVTQLITWRYLTQSTDKPTISTMVYICFISIFIGAFSLTLVSAIMNGIEQTTLHQMQGINAHLIIRGYDDILNVPAIQTMLTQRFPTVAASCPSTIEHVILQAYYTQDTTSDTHQNQHIAVPTIALLKAIDPAQEACVTRLHKTILETRDSAQNLTHDLTHNLVTLLQDNQIMIGYELAKTLGVTCGDQIEILHADTAAIRARTVTFDATTATISAIFKTGIDDYDSNLIITSFDFLATLLPESGPTQLNLRLDTQSATPEKEALLINELRKTLGLEVISWRALYPAIISALTLEKYAMFFILTLIMLVASMNSIALLFMQITQKRGDIAILKAMGTHPTTIEQIFVSMGMAITLSATIPGIICGAITSIIIDHYRLITLPDAYYISHLPAHVAWPTIFVIFFVIVIISLCAVYSAARKTRTINIAHVLRFEG